MTAFDSNVDLTIEFLFGADPMDVDWAQSLRLNGNSLATTPDSAALSILDNLDIRIRVLVEDWTAGVQTFVSKRDAGNEWQFRIESGGLLGFIWWDATSTLRTTQADTAHGFASHSTHWVRVRRSGTTVQFFTSDTDTNDHTAVAWSQLGANVATSAGNIIDVASNPVTVGSAGLALGELLQGYVSAVTIVDDVTTIADPVFADPAEWTIGDDAGDTASDGVNTWTLGDAAVIVGQPDLISRIRSWRSQRGRQYELDRVEAGTLNLRATNSDGFLNPENSQGDYYPNVRPMVPVRVTATYNTVRYPVFTGFIEAWPPSFPVFGKDSIVDLRAVDAFDVLAGQPLRGFWPDVIDADAPIAWWRLADNTDETGNGHTLAYNGTPGEDVPGAWVNDLAIRFDGTDDFATITDEVDLELLADMSFEVWFKPVLDGIIQVDTFSADDTWTAPSGVTQVTVECWGAGGGGQAGDSTGQGGGGGGGGAYAKSVVTVVPGNNYAIDVGTAGPAGLGGDGTLGGVGLESSFGSTTVVAAAGKGGGVSIPSGTNPVGGAGGQANDSTGTITRSGGAGGDSGTASGTPSGGGDPNYGGGGGGGGSASLSSNGGSGQDGASATGGSGGTADSGGGGGGHGADLDATGTAGTAPGGGGGGGGGAANPSAPAEGDGGAGAAGRVKLTYFAPFENVLFSCMGASTPIYELNYTDLELRFAPGDSSTDYYSFGACADDEWHHAVVTIDWSGSTRIIKGYLDGQLLIDQTSSYQPGAETRAVNIGRRATAADNYFEGDISEVVFYDRVLTAVEVGEHWNANSESLPSQLTSARVSGVLAAIGWQSGSTISTGQTTMIAIAASAADTAMDAIREADTTEQGLFFVGPDGLPTFRDRHYRLENHAVSQATFADDGVDLPYSDIVFSYDNELIKNDITVTDGTNTVQLRNDESIDRYGRRVASFTISTSDANELTDTAYFLLAKLSEPALRVDTLVIQPQANVALWPIVLGLDIGDRLTVKKTLAGDDVEADFHIESIAHDVTAQKTWQTTWQLSPASSQAFWTLGVANLSELDETTVLAY
jgi:hypothetical protein